ncbi:hypothetical protein [Luteibaculum oceani]|uniref:ABC transporter ATPase n=1 Tax=Luteibaculum oceani TaxID=1294296 RepID=A0A5C6V821_9FLAO|nr:hypothetical protein [Luteibaculum oceani]TXC81443.1 hypothetical protein FRX97_05405 [Luteibaculum oceani]
MEFLPGLPDRSRLWVYLIDKKLEGEDLAFASNQLLAFMQNWKAHGTDLVADFDIVDGQLLIIGVDEENQNATGCSIDSQVRFVQDLGGKLDVNFFDRQLLALYRNNKFKVISFDALNKGLENGKFAQTDKVLDHLIQSLGDLRKTGIKPLSESWHQNLVSV